VSQAVSGCTDQGACNFDASATDDDGSCQVPPAGTDCEGRHETSDASGDVYFIHDSPTQLAQGTEPAVVRRR
jgi:hypothetical protein